MNAHTPADAQAAATGTPAVPAKPAPKVRALRKTALMLSVPLLLALGAGGWWLSGGGSETTENANLHQPRLSIAPTVGGRVSAVNVQELQHVSAGDLLFQVDPEPYQLAVLQAEAAVSATFDAAPGHSFAGHVEAIGAGTGAEFSLLPAQNATGNWVKVTQRVPVRIRLDDPSAVATLASGISAEVTVDTSQHPAPKLAAVE